jgi:hypothetical protein
MPPSVGPIAPGAVARLAGSRPARSIVNSGFHWYAKGRGWQVGRLSAHVQKSTLHRLVRHATNTRFGRDHGFSEIRNIEDFQRQVPLRTYDDLWELYLKARYPVFDDLTWPGRMPYLALTSGTTTGVTKYIPVSEAMVRSNQRAAKTMIAAYLRARPASRLFHGKLFFLGGSSTLEAPAAGVEQGDLSAIAAATTHHSPLTTMSARAT